MSDNEQPEPERNEQTKPEAERNEQAEAEQTDPPKSARRMISHPDDARRRKEEEQQAADEKKQLRREAWRANPDNPEYEAPERDKQEYEYPEYAHPDDEDYLPRPEFIDEIVETEELPSTTPPPNPRRQNRIAAMQFLYMSQVTAPDPLSGAIYEFFTTREKERDFYAFGEELAVGAWEQREQVDEAIVKHAKNWTLARIARVDLAILRLAIYELLYRRDIPPIVTINEAIDLSKEYSTPDAKRFINGILDKVKDTLDRPFRTADV